MISRLSGLVIAFALAVNAFLIPSTVSLPESDDQFKRLLFTPVPLNTAKLRASIDCEACSQLAKIDEEVPSALIDSSHTIDITLNLAISNDKKALEIDGQALTSSERYTTVPAELVVEAIDNPSLGSNIRLVGASLSTDVQIVAVEISSGSEFRKVSIRVNSVKTDTLEVEDLALEPLIFYVVSDAEGRLTILDIARGEDQSFLFEDVEDSVIEAYMTDSHHDDGSEELFTIQPVEDLGQHNAGKLAASYQKQSSSCLAHVPEMFCRLKNVVTEKVNRLRHKIIDGHHPCAAMKQPYVKGGVGKYWRAQDANLPPLHIQRHRNSVTHTLRRILTGFVVPVMIGIAAGVTVCLIGMVIGRLMITHVSVHFLSGNGRMSATSGRPLGENETYEKAGLLDENDTM